MLVVVLFGCFTCLTRARCSQKYSAFIRSRRQEKKLSQSYFDREKQSPLCFHGPMCWKSPWVFGSQPNVIWLDRRLHLKNDSWTMLHLISYFIAPTKIWKTKSRLKQTEAKLKKATGAVKTEISMFRR